MIYKHRFCLWLIDKLLKEQLTFTQIQKAWANSASNDEGVYITNRTFDRYRRDAEDLMKVEIKCTKYGKGEGLYSIAEPDDLQNERAQKWLLSAFRVSRLAEYIDNRCKVMIEDAPSGAERLLDIMDAIDGKKTLDITYRSHYKDSNRLYFIPFFVRLFKQRWYVIGEDLEKKQMRTMALERIIALATTNRVDKVSKNCKGLMTPESYFEHCYGVIRQFEPITIRFRAFWPQDAYIRNVPIHSSQIEVNSTSDYSDFEIFVRPTYDLKQELLWHRDKLAVLAPESFRLDMINVLKSTLAGYESGECNAIDE